MSPLSSDSPDVQSFGMAERDRMPAAPRRSREVDPTTICDALIGAATVGGVNGIWLVQLTPDRHACGSPPVRLPTTPGDLIDFVGTVFVPPPPPGLRIRREQDEVVVFWPRTAWRDILESTVGSVPSPSWTPISSPFVFTNGLLEYHIPSASLQAAEFFRLRRP